MIKIEIDILPLAVVFDALDFFIKEKHPISMQTRELAEGTKKDLLAQAKEQVNSFDTEADK